MFFQKYGLVETTNLWSFRPWGSLKDSMFKLMHTRLSGTNPEPPVMKSAATRKWWSAPWNPFKQVSLKEAWAGGKMIFPKNWHGKWKIPFSYRKYIFKGWMFHCHVSLSWGGTRNWHVPLKINDWWEDVFSYWNSPFFRGHVDFLGCKQSCKRFEKLVFLIRCECGMLWVASWVWVFVYKNHTIKDNVLKFRAAFCGENRLVSLKGKGGTCSFS